MKKKIYEIRKKLKNNSGFSLVELLFSILILMLSTSVVILCFNLGIGNFVKQTRASEAQLLCQSLATSLQNELTYAQDIVITGGNLDTYFSSSRRMGKDSKISSSSGEIYIQNGTEVYPLVAKSNYSAENRAAVSGSGYFLKAYLDNDAIQWSDAKKAFVVTIWVDDANNAALSATDAKTKALAYMQFSVKPLSGIKTSS